MGYKRAGCTIVAANDIDPEMAWHYRTNLAPPSYYLCPIGDLLKKDLPRELYELDILDGSPPCSTFSMAGSREKSWGKDKHFREGQAKQVLSDLFFDYLDVVERFADGFRHAGRSGWSAAGRGTGGIHGGGEVRSEK